MSELLDNLKDALDKGEFNSEAAKKINEIGKKADEIDPNEAEKLVEKRLEESGTKVMTEDEVVAQNTEYDKEMERIKYGDAVNRQVATLQDMENMVLLSIQDMIQYIKTVEEKFQYNEEYATKSNELKDEVQRILDRFDAFI